MRSFLVLFARRSSGGAGRFPGVGLASLACVIGVSPAVGQSDGDGSADRRRPNFVVLFSDDAGYADFGFQESCPSEMRAVTPRLTALASDGVRFTSGYVSGAVCSPSRAGLLTGRYQQRFGHEMNIPPGYAGGGLPLSEKLIGDRLRPLGYATGLIGKWHLGYPPEYQPNRRGFDHFFGFLQGARNYLPYPADKAPPHQVFQENGTPLPEGGYSTDRIGEAARRFIESSRDRPFFLFVAFNAVHGPLQARPSDLEALAGIDNPRHRQYVGMMKALDENVGRILDALASAGLADTTLVVFTNDNGGQTGLTASNAPLRGKKGDMWEGGIRVPMLMRWPGVIAAGRVVDDPVITLDFLPTFLAAAGARDVVEDGALDGIDLLPLLRGDAERLPERDLFWRSGGASGRVAMRDGQWKLVHNRHQDGAKAELYDLANDIGEQNDLAARNPDRVGAMQARLRAWEGGLTEPLWGSGDRAARPRPDRSEGRDDEGSSNE